MRVSRMTLCETANLLFASLSCGTVLAFQVVDEKISIKPTARTRNSKRRFVVVSTRGTSAGSVAEDGLMAIFGRAPMLPADYSFFVRARLCTNISEVPNAVRFTLGSLALIVQSSGLMKKVDPSAIHRSSNMTSCFAISEWIRGSHSAAT